MHHLDDPPHNRLLGPVFARGGAAGVIAIDGEVQCQWGDIHRADMTFSVTKSYLAMVAGIAVADGLIPDIDQPVSDCLEQHGVRDHGFEDEHNRQITWRHLLHFTSEWSGSCFGVPDQIDHYRNVSMQPTASTQRKGDKRPLKTPGTYWEYNDVRINQFSLALMRLFDQELPEIFAERIMQPLGASDTWHWHGYENSFIESNGKRLQSVPGGGHWGGGMVISAHDQLLLGNMMINNGLVNRVQLLPASWIEAMRMPCDIAPWYGYFTWLNTDHVISRDVPEESYFAMGIGGQLVWHDPTRGIVGVFRWVDSGGISGILGVVGEACRVRVG
jgi:CubicO group peptidase (beta-lactamase class C family)